MIPEPAPGAMVTPPTPTVTPAALRAGGGLGTSAGERSGRKDKKKGRKGKNGRKGKSSRQGERHVFPLPARHTYGDGFGAGRGHKGQDVFAKCGKKIIAARGGKIQYSGYQSSAGNYVVIDGRGTEWDYVYMHLRKRGLPKTGAKIGTGDLIGYNGDTGNASGCHLHFEMWDPTGWYEGGKAKPPTKFLESWDAYS